MQSATFKSHFSAVEVWYLNNKNCPYKSNWKDEKKIVERSGRADLVGEEAVKFWVWIGTNLAPLDNIHHGHD